MPDLTALEFTTRWDDTTSFPFIEDEDANITGYGHQDREAFAAEVNRYDDVCNCDNTFADDERWSAEHVVHRWAVCDEDAEVLHVWLGDEPVTAQTPGAFPITTLWGER